MNFPQPIPIDRPEVAFRLSDISYSSMSVQPRVRGAFSAEADFLSRGETLFEVQEVEIPSITRSYFPETWLWMLMETG